MNVEVTEGCPSGGRQLRDVPDGDKDADASRQPCQLMTSRSA